MTRIAVIVGNPKQDSFSRALADAYRSGAEGAGHEVRLFDLSRMAFDPVLHRGFEPGQALEPDLAEAQEAIRWAEHTVWVWPLWLGFPPALMKGFLERALTLGFALEKDGRNMGHLPLLGGRSARIVVTMAMPVFIYYLMAGARSVRTFRANVLAYVGFRPVRTTLFGMAEVATAEKRARWLEKMRDLGRRAA